MKLPSLVDYQEAVQAPSASFVDPMLRRGRPRYTQLGSLAVASGGFALTFDVTADGRRYAVRCFHRPGRNLKERYAEIAEFITNTRGSLSFLIDVTYVTAGIRVREVTFPVVRMPWVSGLTLNEWVDDHLDTPGVLHTVRRQIQDAVAKMHREGAAHGDLQHGNILVDSRNNIHLVDYDGMFLPPLRHLGAAESGHRNYQHPDRGNSYDQRLDTFAAFVIDLSLNAIAHDRTLWKEFNTGENLLFSVEDYTNPERSDVFRRLARISPLAEQVRRLQDACAAEFTSVPAVLSGQRPARLAGRRPAAGDRRPTGPAPVLAYDRPALLARLGDEITVIGRVVAVKRLTTRNGKPMTFINLGDYKRGDFAIVAFDRASYELAGAFGTDLRDLEQSWISLHGLLTLYQSKWSTNPTPQIELRRARSLRLLEPSQVETLIANAQAASGAGGSPSARPPTPAARPQQPSRPLPPGARADDIDRRISSRYSSPGFARTPDAGWAPPPVPTPPLPPPSWWHRVRRRLGL